MSTKNASVANSAELQEVLDDLCMRFLLNLPVEEYESFERLFFAIEAAHWFYDDFYRERTPSLPRLPLKQFAAKIFHHTALLHQYHDQVEKLTAQFQSYKQIVMTCGAALLNPSMDKVVLVRGWGNAARWGFPKGKLAKNETELDAAVREVLEETGFDMTPHVTTDQFFVDSFTSGRHCRIYFVPGVPEDTIFETLTRKEISDIQWVPIAILPDSPKNAKNQNKATMGKRDKSSPTSDKKILFAQNGVAPFTKRLRAWIKRQRKEQNRNTSPKLHKAANISTDGLNSTFLSYIQEPDHQTNVLDTSQMLSVEELEANLRSESKENPTSNRRRGSKGKNKGGGEVAGRGNGKKSRRDTETYEVKRNQMTFGIDGGTAMNNSERDRLFRRYVMETDRIAEAQGLRDEFWPVPFVTSKDFSAEEKRDAEEVSRNYIQPQTTNQNGFESVSFVPPDQPDRSDLNTARRRDEILQLPRPRDKVFEFDRRAVMASMMTIHPS